MGPRFFRALLLLSIVVGYMASLAGLVEYRSSLGFCEASVGRAVVFECDRVYSLPEARVLGVVHLSILAPIYFTLLGLAAVWYWSGGARLALQTSVVLSLAGLVLVPYLVYLEAFRAGAFCLWCTVMHVSIVAAALASTVLLRLSRHPPGLRGQGGPI